MSIFEKEGLRVGEFITAVCAIHDREEAKQFVFDYRAYLMRVLKPNCGPAVSSARNEDGSWDYNKLLRFNIGWCFGEGMSEADRAMWQEVCNAAHPIFGTTMPRFVDEALAAGIKAGKKIRKEMRK